MATVRPGCGHLADAAPGWPVRHLHSEGQGGTCFFFVQTGEPRRLKLGDRYFQNSVFVCDLEHLE